MGLFYGISTIKITKASKLQTQREHLGIKQRLKKQYGIYVQT